MAPLDLKPDTQKDAFFVHAENRGLMDPVQQRPGLRAHIWRPRTDVYETEDVMVVRVEVAGMREDDFSVVLDGRYLSIRGVRPDTVERRAYHQMEIPYGEFASELELPAPVVVSEIVAVYENGFLRVTLPIARPQKIEIED